MLCESCQQKEAIVHLTIVTGPVGETARHNFCEPCFQEAEAERLKGQDVAPTVFNLPMVDVENITATEYLEASAKANANGVDKPAFKRINDELGRLPKTEQRLVFEMFEITWQSLERGDYPGWPALFSAAHWQRMEPENLREYISWLEKILIKCWERLKEIPGPVSEYSQFPFTISMFLIAICKLDSDLYTGLVEKMKFECKESKNESLPKLVSALEDKIAKQE